MKNLTDWFGRVCIITCQHRPDRLAETLEHLTTTGLADPEKLHIQKGVIGAWTTVPVDWLPGLGAWGCLRSHQRLLEDVIHERNPDMSFALDSVLILEDDVFFVEDALPRLNEFMEAVPEDWGQIYLGGQHKAGTKTINSKVVRGGSVNRTHAHAIRWPYYHEVYRHITYSSDYIGTHKHVDHQLEVVHQRADWPVYCPTKWIAGQRENLSIITGKLTEEKLWQP
jgi:hypothetical protein